MTPTDKTIIVCGSGLAASMTAVALANGLGGAYRVILAKTLNETRDDVFYGSVTAPIGYDFFRALGLDEPALFLSAATSFSFGTRYRNWPSLSSDWMQCHHQPLPVLAGVPLQHHLVRNSEALQPLLISAVAAQDSKFAHPPEDPAVPLSRAEYGYQFSPDEWTKLLQDRLVSSGVKVLAGPVEEIVSDGDEISGVRMSNGETVRADLYVDCSGTERLCLKQLSLDFQSVRAVSASVSHQPATQLGPPCRVIEAITSGWVAQTFLQDGVTTLRMTHSSSGEGGDDQVHCNLGRVQFPWLGNCVAIGHAASVIEPLTPAPMMLLQRDIERLLDLIPVSAEMSAERREFNRRFDEDVTNSDLFGNALFVSDTLPQSTYWQEAAASAQIERLQRKIAQFLSRGVLVKFDLEPFNDEDWTTLHNGMGRRPTRYDLQVERVSKAEIERQLSGMKQAVAQMVARMPPHHLYVANMKRYLERQRHA